MHGVVGAALFAVIDDVDAALDLLRDDVGDRAMHGGLQFGFARAGFFFFGEQEFDHLGGARQAAGVGGEDTVGQLEHPGLARSSPYPGPASPARVRAPAGINAGFRGSLPPRRPGRE